MSRTLHRVPPSGLDLAEMLLYSIRALCCTKIRPRANPTTCKNMFLLPFPDRQRSRNKRETWSVCREPVFLKKPNCSRGTPELTESYLHAKAPIFQNQSEAGNSYG